MFFISDEVKGVITLNESVFTERCSVLKKFVDANIEREKQVLYALQQLMVQLEHPSSKSTLQLMCVHAQN